MSRTTFFSTKKSTYEDYKFSQIVDMDGRELDVVILFSSTGCLNSSNRQKPSKRMVVTQLSRARSEGRNA